MSTPSPYSQPGYPDAGQQPGYPNAGYGPPGYGTGVAPKSKVTAALLAFFLGQFGAHNFYLGQKGRAVGHIVLFVVGMLIVGFASVALFGSVDARGNVDNAAAAGSGIIGLIGYLVILANGIWTLVEFIMILVNKDGSLQ